MILKILGAFLAIVAFATIIETPKKYLWCAGAVGAIGWFVYMLVQEVWANDILSTFLSAFSIAFVSHVFARIFKTPVTVFLIAGILPTVPGAGMYRIVYYLIEKNSEMSSYYLVNTLELAGVIALALFVVDAIFRLFQKGWKQNSLRYQEKKIDKSSKIV